MVLSTTNPGHREEQAFVRGLKDGITPVTSLDGCFAVEGSKEDIETNDWPMELLRTLETIARLFRLCVSEIYVE